MRLPFLASLSFLLPILALAAGPKLAVLDVQNMTCSLCPITVRKALEKVSGVTEVEVDLAKKTASVKFDADKATVAALVKATTEAGFPSSERQ